MHAAPEPHRTVMLSVFVVPCVTKVCCFNDLMSVMSVQIIDVNVKKRLFWVPACKALIIFMWYPVLEWRPSKPIYETKVVLKIYTWAAVTYCARRYRNHENVLFRLIAYYNLWIDGNPTKESQDFLRTQNGELSKDWSPTRDCPFFTNEVSKK